MENKPAHHTVAQFGHEQESGSGMRSVSLSVPLKADRNFGEVSGPSCPGDQSGCWGLGGNRAHKWGQPKQTWTDEGVPSEKSG